MSSTYRILCLSHDPALVFEPEWGSASHGAAVAADVAANPALHEKVAAHASCDLLVGRWSGGLVEFCCPRRQPDEAPRHRPFHTDTRWIDVAWLRLAAAASVAKPDDAVRAALDRLDGCWSGERLNRLRNELNP